MSSKKMKSIGVATLKTLGAQYSSFSGVVEQVTSLHAEFELELSQVLNLLQERQRKQDSHTLLTKEDSVLITPLKRSAGVNLDSDESITADDICDDAAISWLKKLFKKIAIQCHPDKVLSSTRSATDKHKRLSSYEQARVALDNANWPMMISIGLLYGEIPEIGITESKKILIAGISGLQSQLDGKQKSIVWAWGMSEEDLQIKSKILVHAAMKMYNKHMSEAEALVAVKEYFEIRDVKHVRKVGSHPGARLKDRRSKTS